MKKILCPTDFSDAAHNAIAYAAKFAQVTGAELVLFNVQSLFDVVPGRLLSSHYDPIEIIRGDLEAQALEVAQQFKISCYSEVQVSGTALSTVISRKAKDFNLIIMGSNGPDDLYQFFAGSNAYNVIRKSEIPILIIPDAVNYSPIENMVYAFDYLEEGTPPLAQLISLLTPFHARLHILQVLEWYTSEQEEELQQQESLIRYVIPDGLQVVFDSVHSGDIGEGIQNYMNKHSSDVLALSTRDYSFIQRLFHHSITKEVSGMADYPVFVFHL